jgi:hypothetical protein
MKVAGIRFEEKLILLFDADWKANIAKPSPSARFPALVVGGQPPAHFCCRTGRGVSGLPGHSIAFSEMVGLSDEGKTEPWTVPENGID